MKQIQILFFALIVVLISSCQEEVPSEILSNADCIPSGSVTNLLCRTGNNSISVNLSNWCGGTYDGEYDIYLQKNGSDLVNLGREEMISGDLSFSTNFVVPSSYSLGNNYSYDLRRVSDGLVIPAHFGTTVSNCVGVVVYEPITGAHDEVERNKYDVRWSSGYFSGNVSVKLMKASDNTVLDVEIASTANDGHHRGNYPWVVADISVYFQVSDGTATFNSGTFTLQND